MAYFTTKGKLVEFGEFKTGTTENGYDWSNLSFTLEVKELGGTYSKMLFKSRNQVADDARGFKLGDMVQVGFTLCLDEYEGKPYNRMEVKKVVAYNAEAMQPSNISEVDHEEQSPGELDTEEKGDLPF